MKGKVLIVTYYFPPRPGIASLRLKGLAKYLPEFGWEPVILTAQLPRTQNIQSRVIQTFYPGDVDAIWKNRLGLVSNKGFQEQIGIPITLRGNKKSVTEKVVNFIKSIIAYPDNQKYWHKYAVNAGNILLNKEHFDALISSSGPVTCHLIAKELKERWRIAWIADFRDLWTQNSYYSYGILRRYFERKLELKTIANADALVTVSKPWAKKLGSLHVGKSVFTIPNGFDPDEVKTLPLTKEFTITYAGHLYQGKRDPTLLFKALEDLSKEGKIDPMTIHVRFFGPKQYYLERDIKKYGLEKIVKQYGMVSREVALNKQRESQVLLLLNWNNPKEQGTCPGKLFEYLAAKRPIISIGGIYSDVVKKILEETHAGIAVSDLEDMKNIILKFYEQYKMSGKVEYCGNSSEVNKYSHIEMAKKFASLLDHLQEKKKGNKNVPDTC